VNVAVSEGVAVRVIGEVGGIRVGVGVGVKVNVSVGVSVGKTQL
jgi:hypothetical protein